MCCHEARNTRFNQLAQANKRTRLRASILRTDTYGGRMTGLLSSSPIAHGTLTVAAVQMKDVRPRR